MVWVNFEVGKLCLLWPLGIHSTRNDGQMSEDGITGATGEMSMGTPRPGGNNFTQKIWQSCVHLLEIHEPPFPLQWESQGTFIRPEEKTTHPIFTAAIDEKGD